MIKVLFICHGNICRSPMAEFIFKDLTTKLGFAPLFTIASAATSAEEIGNPVYPPARRKLWEHGIDSTGQTARRLIKKDYTDFDFLIAAEQYNIPNITRITGGDPDHKIHRLLDFSTHPRDIADPWYTGDFERAWDDIFEVCEAFLDHLQKDGYL